MALPNTIIIGAQKAGTTSLYNWLSQHPEVYGEASMKDFPFFVDDKYFTEGLNWFSESFNKYNQEKVILHGNVNYMYFSELASDRILNNLDENTKIITILRNPVDRAYSAYWHQIKVGFEDMKTFEEALLAEEARKSSGNFRILSEQTYVEHGFYSKQLYNFFKKFDNKNIKVILFEELAENEEEVMKDLFHFLNIDDTFKPNYIKKNESGVPRFKFIQKIFSNKSLPNNIKSIIPISTRVAFKSKLRNINIIHKRNPKMNIDTRYKLLKIYEDEVRRLEKLLNVDLYRWKQ